MGGPRGPGDGSTRGSRDKKREGGSLNRRRGREGGRETGTAQRVGERESGIKNQPGAALSAKAEGGGRARGGEG